MQKIEIKLFFFSFLWLLTVSKAINKASETRFGLNY